MNPRIQESVFFGLLFIVLSSPLTYQLVDRVVGQPLLHTRIIENGVPTRVGLVIHGIVYALAYYFFA
jgi:hypothetical protein